MSPPLSRMERGNPPSRRKSCQACVTAKRRCDQRSPACLRCAQRKIRCEYPTRLSRNIRSTPAQSPGALTTFQPDIQPGGARQDEAPLNAMDMSQYLSFFESPWLGDEADGLQFDEMALGAAEGPLLSDELVDTSNSGQNNNVLGSDEQNGTGYPVNFAESAASSATTDLAARPPLEFSAPRRLDVAALTNKLESRLSYAVDKIKDAPRTMVLENETPWCHPQLYRGQMPRVMQDAVSSCALYIAKNPVNAPVVMSCIDARVNDLLDSTPPGTPLDTLARTQALLLYQIIRFFDGDIIARSSADATFAELESSVFALSHHISWASQGELDSPGPSCRDVDGPDSPLQPSRDSWRRWIFQESARRTFLVASFFTKTWKLLTGRPLPACRCSPQRLRESWTLSAPLWQARDAYEFSLAWRGKKHYVVTRKTVMSTLADAGRDDIEIFGKMLLATNLGIDGARAWLGKRGVAL